MKFNEKIIRLRKIKGITQDELASAVGVSRQAVYKWECGQSYPEVAKLIEIKLLFNISIDDLLDDSYEIALPEKKKKKRQAKPRAKTAETAKPEKKEEIVAIAEEVIEAVEADVDESVPAATEEAPALKDEALASESLTEQNISEPISVPAASAAVDTAANAAQPIEENVSEEAVKKSGFFGRLFGRK